MKIEDIERYIVRYNIDKKSNKAYFVDNRMYIYAILYHIHDWSLAKIGKRFNKGHDTIRNALLDADIRQSQDGFLENVKLLHEQYFFIIPPYKSKTFGKKPDDEEDEYILSLRLSRKQYYEYLRRKNIDEIYDMLWQLTLKEAKAYNKCNPSNKDKYKQS